MTFRHRQTCPLNKLFVQNDLVNLFEKVCFDVLQEGLVHIIVGFDKTLGLFRKGANFTSAEHSRLSPPITSMANTESLGAFEAQTRSTDELAEL